MAAAARPPPTTPPRHRTAAGHTGLLVWPGLQGPPPRAGARGSWLDVPGAERASLDQRAQPGGLAGSKPSPLPAAGPEPAAAAPPAVDPRPIWHPDVIRERLEREEAEQALAALGFGGGGLQEVPALLLAEERPPTRQEVQRVEDHRWKFHGAAEFAQQSQGLCSFVGCLLDLQERVQLDEEVPAMEAKLLRACKTFLRGQCIRHRSGDMYHLLAHFLSNAPIFDQWERFLTAMLQSERANEESFFTAHVEQVWSRFTRFRSVLESIFDALDEKYAPDHRFPTVSNLVNDHMKRRCFSSQGMLRNEVLTGLTLRVPDETLRDIRNTFDIG